MKDRPIVLLDACVLIPMPLADTLLRLYAGPGLFLPRWSDAIMAEVGRSLRRISGFQPRRPCIAKARFDGIFRKRGSVDTRR